MKKTIIGFLLFAAALVSAACSDDTTDAGGRGPVGPRLLSIMPKAGYAGNTAILSGSNFSVEAAENSVTINGVEAVVTEATPTRLTITLPQNPAGTYPVAVKVGACESVEEVEFTYSEEPVGDVLAITTVSPTSGYAGDAVVIRGTCFSTTPSENKVEINGRRAEVTRATATKLELRMPENDEGTFTFTVSVGKESVSGLMFTYLHVPTLALFSVAPESGMPGEEVTIAGECFSPVASENKVEIGGVEAEVVSATDAAMRVKLPELGAGVYTVKVTVGDKSVEGLRITLLMPAKRYVYTVSTFLGTAGRDTGKVNQDGGPAEAKFNMPHGLCYAPDGSVWIIDRGNNSIRRMDIATRTLTTLAKNGQNGVTFNAPWLGAFNSKGEFYFANKAAKNIVKIAGGDHTASVVVSGLTDPLAVTFDAQDNMFIVDRGASAIVRCAAPGYTEKSEFVKLAGALCAEFDSKGNLIVATNTRKIVAIAPDGTQTDLAGSGTKGASDGEPEQPLTAQFGDMWGLSIDGRNNIYVVDGSYHNIRRFSPDASGDYAKGTVKTVIGTGKAGKVDGVGTAASVNTPYDVLVNEAGTEMWISDLMNFLVRRVEITEE